MSGYFYNPKMREEKPSKISKEFSERNFPDILNYPVKLFTSFGGIGRWENLLDKIKGTFYGMAIGDAMGMPSELWSRRKVKAYFGRIDTFLDGPRENEVARLYQKGQFTDDTAQALVLLDALIGKNFKVDEGTIAKKLLDWAERTEAFEKQILGPNSKAALMAIQKGEDPSPITSKAETNGAAMRIAPIGCLFDTDHPDDLVAYVFRVSKITHATDVAIAGAAMIAAAVSAALEDRPWEEIIDFVDRVYDRAQPFGTETISPSLKRRLQLGIRIADRYAEDEDGFLQEIYDTIGAGVLTSESVPAAISIAYYAKRVERCALLCANLGGDTDTIGAMATAICGAKQGASRIDPDLRRTIDETNGVPFEEYAWNLFRFRNRLNGGI